MTSHRGGAEFPIPFRNAPYNTHHIVSMDDFKTTNLSSYIRHNAHSINKAVHDASKERRTNQSVTCKLDPPFRLWLTEKETRRKDYIKFKFEKRGLNGHRPSSHLITKKELRNHHLRNEVDDYHLSQDVELCDNTVHPDHKLTTHPHANQYSAAAQRAQHSKSMSSLQSPLSKTPPNGMANSPSFTSKPAPTKNQVPSPTTLPPVGNGNRSPMEPKKSLW